MSPFHRMFPNITWHQSCHCDVASASLEMVGLLVCGSQSELKAAPDSHDNNDVFNLDELAVRAAHITNK